MFKQVSSVAIFHKYIHTIVDINDIVELHYVRMINVTNNVQLSRQKFGDEIMGSFFPIYNLARNFDMFPTVQNFTGESYFAVWTLPDYFSQLVSFLAENLSGGITKNTMQNADWAEMKINPVNFRKYNLTKVRNLFTSVKKKGGGERRVSEIAEA